MLEQQEHNVQENSRNIKQRTQERRHTHKWKESSKALRVMCSEAAYPKSIETLGLLNPFNDTEVSG